MRTHRQGFTMVLSLLFGLLLLGGALLAVMSTTGYGRRVAGSAHKAQTLEAADAALAQAKQALQSWLAENMNSATQNGFSAVLATSQLNNYYLTIGEVIQKDIPVGGGILSSVLIANNEAAPIVDTDQTIRLTATALALNGVKSTVESYVKIGGNCWHGEVDGFCLPKIPGAVVMSAFSQNGNAVVYKKQQLWMGSYTEVAGTGQDVLPVWNCLNTLPKSLPLWKQMQPCITSASGSKGVFAFFHGAENYVDKLKLAATASLIGSPQQVGESSQESDYKDLRTLADLLYALPEGPKVKRFNKANISKETFLGDRDHPQISIFEPKNSIYTRLKKGAKGTGIALFHATSTSHPNLSLAWLGKGSYFEGLVIAYGKNNRAGMRYGVAAVHNGAAVLLSGDPEVFDGDTDNAEIVDDEDDVSSDEESELIDNSSLVEIKNLSRARLFKRASIHYNLPALNLAAQAAAGLIPALWNNTTPQLTTLSWREVQ